MVEPAPQPLIDHPQRPNSSEHYVAPAWLKRNDVVSSTRISPQSVTALPALPRYRQKHEFDNFLREFGIDPDDSPLEVIEGAGRFLDWWDSKYDLRPSKNDYENYFPQFLSETSPEKGGDVT